MITPTHDIQPALDHLESALEATCATLVTLESVGLGGEGTGDTSAVQAQIRSAIASLREAMSALRALHDVETSMLAFGFVLGGDPDSSVLCEWPQKERRGRQVRPRRTA